MNVKEFTYLLQHPNAAISSDQTKHLEDVLSEFPYFQAARAVHLKALKNLNSYKYNKALKTTAAYTTDREILFDFITSKEFLQNSIADSISGKTTAAVDTEIISEEILLETDQGQFLIEKSQDQPLPQNTSDADTILDPDLFKSKDPKVDADIKKAKDEAVKKLEIGKPLVFTQKEKYSFGEWLQLTSNKKIKRAPEKKDAKIPVFELEKKVLKNKNFELIDKFIAENPKIVPSEKKLPKIDLEKDAKIDANELMTETLAKVYLEQKKYKKAVQAYRILSLKYPEKSGFFADRIKAVENIQKENT